MSFVDKLKFWEKKPSFDNSFGLGMESDYSHRPGPGLEAHQAFGNGTNNFGSQDFSSQYGQQPVQAMDLSQHSGFGNDFPDSTMGLDHNKITGIRDLPQQGFGFSQQPMQPMGQQQFSSPQMQQSHDYSVEKNLEVISAKLDMLRSAIESMNQRLINIERIANQEQENDRKRRNSW